MSKSDLAISVRGLSKEYSIAQNKDSHSTLAETLLNKLNIFSNRQNSQRNTFRALNDVSFDVRKGEVVGVIGRNGAGKSTLLKILSRITDPSSGVIDLYGRVGSLLEVGTGFHPELTGRENIFLNGAILGMARSEIHAEFDNIVEFAGVEKFLDTPVKRYSSGMYVRLAFAVAAHLRSEILVVDEVLAVGDSAFQKKCLGKMHEVATNGRTVFLVSHHMPSIKSLCTKAVVLDQGSLAYCGTIPQALLHYESSIRDSAARPAIAAERRRGTGELRFKSFTIQNEHFGSTACKTFSCEVQNLTRDSLRFDLIFVLKSASGTELAQLDSRLLGLDLRCEVGSRAIHVSFATPWLKEGKYIIDGFVCGATAMDEYPECCAFDVLPDYPYPETSNPQALEHGDLLADFSMTVGDRVGCSRAAPPITRMVQ